MKVFRHSDYRAVISRCLIARKKAGTISSYAHFAEQIKVQKTYVSKVLKGEAHFSSDQLYAACDILNLSPDETDYLLLLLEHERCTHPKRKRQLQGRIFDIQSEKKHVRNHLETKMINAGEEKEMTAYYLDPYMPLIHMYLTLPKFQALPALLSKALGLPQERVRKKLQTLQKLGLIEQKSVNSSVELRTSQIFLPGESPLSFPSEILSRQMILEHLQKLEPHQRLLISLNFSADKATKNQIHAEFLKFLRTSESLIKKAPCEQVYRMNFDLFPWSLNEDEA